MTKQIVRVGDIHKCPIHGDNVVVSGQSSMTDPKSIAGIGDKCACGGIILEGTQALIINGKQTAYTGCKTSCGGEVIGSSSVQLDI